MEGSECAASRHRAISGLYCRISTGLRRTTRSGMPQSSNTATARVHPADARSIFHAKTRDCEGYAPALAGGAKQSGDASGGIECFGVHAPCNDDATELQMAL
jgi:hypothetical protein